MFLGFVDAQKFSLGLEVGYGSTGRYFDSTGNRVKFFEDTNYTASQSFLSLRLNGMYYFNPKIYIGANLGFCESTFSLSYGYASFSVGSGFSAQIIDVFLGASSENINGSIGYHFDIGPQPTDTPRLSNSDKQNALLLGLDVKFPLKDTVWSFYGNFDGIITFEGW